jgi:GntR family transcriptional regulator / MocR family aminotransferase
VSCEEKMPPEVVINNDRFTQRPHDHYHRGDMKKTPTGIAPVITVDRKSARPLYRQVYEGYREAIVERRLRAGQRLPSTRSLAAELQVSRLPILSAFDQLLTEGYIEGRVGSGTFVASTLPNELPAPRPAIRQGRRNFSKPVKLPPEPAPRPRGWGAFRVSEPAVEHFPFQVWSSLVARTSRNLTKALMLYGDPMGHRAFREVLAGYLGTARALRCDADQITVVSGSQQALELSARVLLERGDQVWLEDPGYSGAREAFTLADARLVPIPVDDEGLDVAAGIARCPRPRAVYVTPSHQYPLGVTMSASRRLKLLDWAQESGAWIIEDDYDSEYRYGTQPVPALQGLDRDTRVIYIGTFSKVLFPALRLGYLVMPRDLVAHFARVRDAADICPPTLYQAVLTDFIAAGHFARHLRRMRAVYHERRDALVGALATEIPSLRVIGDPAGMHLAAVNDKLRDGKIAERAAAEGLWTMPLSECYLGEVTRRGFVLGYGGVKSDDLVTAVRRLRGLIKA